MFAIPAKIAAARHEIIEKPVWERGALIFWLLGPLFVLIERSPADFWVVILDIAFLIMCLVRKQWHWVSAIWVRATLAFIVATFLSAAFSALPAAAATEAILWVRFPLFVAATLYWLGTNKATLQLMLVSLALGLATMMLILSTELYFNYDTWATPGSSGGRLHWPYGDPVPGSYLAKFGLVAAIWVAAAMSSTNKTQAAFAAIAAALLVSFTVFTGERINAITVTSTIGLAIVVTNFRRWRFLATALSSLIIILTIAITRADFIAKKFTSNLILGLTNFENSGYIHLWKTGLGAFETSPITGIGTGMFRFLCDTIEYGSDITVRCDNHPHQYYVQLLAETGIIGFTLFTVMIGSIIFTLWQNGRRSTNLTARLCFIVPLALYFPIQASPDIFGQWNNVMIWPSIALAMALAAQKSEDVQNANGKASLKISK